VWGGELLLADYDGFERLAHLSYVPLPGGDAAVQRPYRMALSHLRAAGVEWDSRLPAVAACSHDERRVLARQLETGLACAPTSSAGRLFDAVSSLAGVCHVAGYEAQAAMELQALAELESDLDRGTGLGTGSGSYRLPLVAPVTGAGAWAGPWTWDCGALVREVAQDVLDGATPGRVAAGFHRALATAVADAVDAVSDVVAGVSRGSRLPVALSGGVFANGLLLGLALQALRGRGYEVLRHREVPPNDGGLALGQTVVGARPGWSSRSGSTIST
jgi:hydrogenase maturation protein HypF